MALFLRPAYKKHDEADLQEIRRMAPGGGNGLCMGHGRVCHNYVCVCRHLVHWPRPFNPCAEVPTSKMRDQKPGLSNRHFKLFLDLMPARMHSWNLQMLANSSKLFSLLLSIGRGRCIFNYVSPMNNLVLHYKFLARLLIQGVQDHFLEKEMAMTLTLYPLNPTLLKPKCGWQLLVQFSFWVIAISYPKKMVFDTRYYWELMPPNVSARRQHFRRRHNVDLIKYELLFVKQNLKSNL